MPVDPQETPSPVVAAFLDEWGLDDDEVAEMEEQMRAEDERNAAFLEEEGW